MRNSFLLGHVIMGDKSRPPLVRWPFLWMVLCCGVVAIFFSVVNPIELGKSNSINSLLFKLNPRHDTYLIDSENISVMDGYYFSPIGAKPGYLLYKISPAYPFRYGVIDIGGWNNGEFDVSISRDGKKYVSVFSYTGEAGFSKQVRLGDVIAGSSQLYLRIDLISSAKGQTNIYLLNGNFVLDDVVSKSVLLSEWELVC